MAQKSWTLLALSRRREPLLSPRGLDARPAPPIPSGPRAPCRGVVRDPARPGIGRSGAGPAPHASPNPEGRPGADRTAGEAPARPGPGAGAVGDGVSGAAPGSRARFLGAAPL